MTLAYRRGRDDVHRRRLYTTRGCDVCGGALSTPSGENHYLYRYTLVPGGDRSLATVLPGLVCSDTCHRLHHREDLDRANPSAA